MLNTDAIHDSTAREQIIVSMRARDPVSAERPPSEEQLLLRELNHRINNEFAAAIGFVSLTAARSRNDEVKTAFDQAAEVVLELPPMEDKAALQPVIMKYALDTSGKPLSEKLSPAAKEKYVKALGELGAPPTAFDKFRPFFAALTVIMAGAQKLGMTGEQGAEAILTKAAKDGKKPISGLETVDYQMSLFANLSEADQIKMLEETLSELDKLGDVFAEMNKHWTSGDSEGMAKLMNDMNDESPAMYKALLTDRNANWAEWIDKRLDKPGVVFMGVGAGHLGGKDSVQDLLAKRGIKSARIANN